MAYKFAFTSLGLLTALLVAACGGDPATGAGGAGGTGASDQGSGGSGGGTGGQGGGTGGQGGGMDALPPTEQNALFAWLKSASYTGWKAESGPHASTGPHPGKVRTFVNTALFDSLAAKNTVHPQGAAAVKELYDETSGKLSGWAVEVKTSADSAGGKGWYWYENLSATDSSNPVAAGNDVPLCFNCHVKGSDYVLTPFPLQ